MYPLDNWFRTKPTPLEKKNEQPMTVDRANYRAPGHRATDGGRHSLFGISKSQYGYFI